MPYKPTKIFVTKEQLISDLATLKTIAAMKRKYNVSSNSSIIYYLNKYNIKYNKKVRNYYVDERSFETETEESMYWAGFLAADGCISIRKNFNNQNLILNLGQNDLNHLIKFKNFMKSQHPIKEFIAKNSQYNENWTDRKIYSLTIGSHKIVSDLKRFNIVSRKTFIYDFPKWLIVHPLAHHFMRGYFDGDGTFGSTLQAKHKTRTYRLSIAGNYNTLNSFGTIICNRTNIHNKSITPHGNIFQLSYGGNNVSKIVGDFLYNNATVFLERKHNRYIEFLKSIYQQ